MSRQEKRAICNDSAAAPVTGAAARTQKEAIMGGPGSGRWPTTWSVKECRVLEIGGLCDGERLLRQPRGELRWVEQGSGVMRASLSYAIAEEDWPYGPQPVLTVRYRKTPSAPESRDHIVLEGGDHRRALALCPGCGCPVRKLYAPPTAEYFFCRDCHGLIYRRPPRAKEQAQRRAAMDSLAAVAADVEALIDPLREAPDEVAAASAASGTPAEQDDELKTLMWRLENESLKGPQEVRIYCLRLAKAGFSLQQIAALVYYSKSSVQRYLAAGLEGIDMRPLVGKRLERYWAPPPAPEGDDPKALRADLAMLGGAAGRLGLYRMDTSEPEERVLIIADAEGAASADIDRATQGTPDRVEVPVGAISEPVVKHPVRRAKSIRLGRW